MEAQTSALILPAADPVLDRNAASKGYVDRKVLEASGGGGGPRMGITDGSDPIPGEVGEVISKVVPVQGLMTIGDAINVDLTTIVLPAGDWDVSGSVYFEGTGKGGDLEIRAWTSDTSQTQPSGDKGGLAISSSSAANLVNELPISVQRFNVTAPTTVYLGAYANFQSGTMQAAGLIRARRMR